MFFWELPPQHLKLLRGRTFLVIVRAVNSKEDFSFFYNKLRVRKMGRRLSKIYHALLIPGTGGL
jgi:hypothetical protein